MTGSATLWTLQVTWTSSRDMTCMSCRTVDCDHSRRRAAGLLKGSMMKGDMGSRNRDAFSTTGARTNAPLSPASRGPMHATGAVRVAAVRHYDHLDLQAFFPLRMPLGCNYCHTFLIDTPSASCCTWTLVCLCNPRGRNRGSPQSCLRHLPKVSTSSPLH